MAGEKDTSQAPAEKAPGGGMVTFIAIGLVSAVMSFGAVFFLAPSGSAAVPVCEVQAPDTGFTPQPLARADQEYVELGEILITIGDEPATRYIKIKTAIVAGKGDASAVKKAQPMLTDAFISYLRSVQLSDFESASFYPRLREQLSRRAELVLGGDVSRGVLVTEFLLR